MAHNNKSDAVIHRRPLFQPSVLALAISSCLAMPALAQEAEKEVELKLERIEVTARRTVESLQEVPVAVTSIGADAIAERGLVSVVEIQQFSPNTTLQASRGTNSTLTAFIRGVGQEDPLWGYEPGVGIYIDDVYVARPQGAVLDILNVERIEVLRGPQGTLYGKNTIGGALKYVTREMTGDTEFSISGTVGSYNQRDVKMTGQLPLIDNKLYIGFGYANLQRDGYGEFLTSALANQDRENYNKDLQAFRLTLEFRPQDNLFFRLNYDKTDDKAYLPNDWIPPSSYFIENRLVSRETTEISLIYDDYLDFLEYSYKKYHDALERLEPIVGRKRAKESARFFLPYGGQITIDVMFNWRSFAHFVNLRADKEAQKEIQEIAEKMLKLVKQTGDFDETIKAFGF
jgi:outer membrane receptor protein involved in Fe transport